MYKNITCANLGNRSYLHSNVIYYQKFRSEIDTEQTNYTMCFIMAILGFSIIDKRLVTYALDEY